MNADNENKVIARYLDGRLLKGTTLDFFPTRGTFRVMDGDGGIHDVRLGDLKAVFFVRSFGGNPSRPERRGFFTRYTQGKKVMVEFHDGETMFGYTLSYTSRGIGFFMFPGDPDSNNTKIFIVHNATRRVKVHSLPARYQTG